MLSRFVWLTVLVPLGSPQYQSYNLFTWQEPTDCNATEFYNSALQACQTCPEGRVASATKSECICPNGQRMVQTGKCANCGQGQSNTNDGMFCLTCAGPNNQSVSSSDGRCQCDQSSIPLPRYDKSGLLRVECQACPNEFVPNRNGFCEKCVGAECYCNQAANKCSDSAQSPVFDGVLVETGQTFKSSAVARLAQAAELGCRAENAQACHTLANLCTLQNLNRDSNTACVVFEGIARTNPSSFAIPSLFYFNSEASIEMSREAAIRGHFHFTNDQPNSVLDFRLATFTLNGTFLGFRPVSDGIMQLCPVSSDRKRGAFKFGRLEKLECRLSLTEIQTQFQNEFRIGSGEMLFHELYLRYIDDERREKMYPIPILNENVRSGGQFVNRLDSSQDNKWILSRRFYLYNQEMAPGQSNLLIRIPAHISLHVNVQLSRDGRIFPPHLRIRHNQYFMVVEDQRRSAQELEEKMSAEHVNLQFQIVYAIDSFAHDKAIEVIMATLSCTCVLWGAIRAYSWGRRAGKLMVDAATVVKFVLFVAESLGNVFVLVIGCTAVWLTLAYKLQKEMLYVALTYEQEWSIVAYIVSAAGLKAVALLHTYLQLIFTETFFIDWERPKTMPDRSRETTMDISGQDLLKNEAKRPAAVVIWRTYLIANEWNELQYYRKTSICIQLIAFLFLMEWLNFKDWALVQPGFETGGIQYAETRTSRLAVDMVVYITVAMTQWLINVLIVEKIVDPFRNFMDLCSVANVSVLAMTHPLRAYYVHGRSVHGMADTDMMKMNMFLQREKENLCGLRGLESNSEIQTFVACLPRPLREKLDNITASIRQPQDQQARMNRADRTTAKVENSAKVHAEMTQLLKDFIDHADPECDYVVTEPRLIEDILDIELSDTSKMGTFIRDTSEMAYSQAFIYGNEWAHMSFELLLFCVLDLALYSRIFAAAIVYATSLTVMNISKIFFTNNLVKSSLVDHRFLI